MSDLRNALWGEGWQALRDQFVIEPGTAYVNHGSFGNAPRAVTEVQNEWRARMDVNATRFFRRELGPALEQARLAVADFLGASDPEGLTLLTNATSGCSAVLSAFPFEAGDEILVTDHGYGATLMAARRRAADTGAEITTVAVPLAASADEIRDLVLAAVTPRTRLAMLDHVTSPTARRFPIEEMVPALQERGVAVLIDAAHTPGMLPVDLAALGADFWTGNMHKWAMAPRAVAALNVAPKWRSLVRPFVVSWREDEGYPNNMLQYGTADLTAYLVAPDGVRFLSELGFDRVRAHNEELAVYGQAVLAQALGVDPTTLPGDPGVSMRLVPLPLDISDGFDFQAVVSDRLGVETAVVPWNGHTLMRVSANVYNAPAEYDRLAEGLPGLL